MKLIDKINMNTINELQSYFTVRTCNLLRLQGIETWEQLKQADDLELLQSPKFDRKCLTECIDLLRLYLDNKLK